MRYFKSYMDKIVDIYKAASAEYCEVYSKLDGVMAERVRVGGDHNLSERGKAERRAELDRDKTALRAELDRINRQAKADALSVRQEAAKDFSGYYGIRPDNLDMGAVELLKSGVLKDRELMELAERYSDNATMLRMIGKYASERDGRDMRVFAQRCSMATNTPHLDVIDKLCEVCNYAVGDAPLSKERGAMTFGNKLDELAAGVYSVAPQIGWDVDDAGNTVYKS